MSNQKKNVLLAVLIVGLVSMTVAYAALITNLKIQGTANVAATSWDIHFANVAVGSGTNLAQADYSLGTLDPEGSSHSTGTLISGMTATLSKPGDKLEVTFDIVNTGTIDAKLASFTKHITLGNSVVSTDTADTNDVVTYTVTCGGSAPATNSVLVKTSGSTSCVLTVRYDDNAMGGTGQQSSQTPGTDQTVSQQAKTFSFDANWQYIQN